MKTILFKTKKLTDEYISENHPDARLKDSCITEESDYDTDMVNLQWSGETPAYDIIDDDGECVARLAWWEEGDDKYKLLIGPLVVEFDNHYDAREAYNKAVEDNEYEDEPQEVKLFCNDEDISD